MIRVAIYPYDLKMLPVIRSINRYNKKYIVTVLGAFPGSGLIGQDAGKAGNLEEMGLLVCDDIFEDSNNWDVLIVPNFKSNEPYLSSIKEVLMLANSIGKNIYTNIRFDSFKAHQKEENTHAKDQLPVTRNKPLVDYIKYPLYQPSSFVVFIGGIQNEMDGYGLFLSLCEKLKEKYSIEAFSSVESFQCFDYHSLHQIIYDKTTDSPEKVIAINQVIQSCCDSKNPDFVIIHSNEAIMEYSRDIGNGYGIIPRLILTSVRPDYFVCGVPYMYSSQQIIQNFKNSIQRRLELKAKFVYVNNTIIDPTDSTSYSAVHLPCSTLYEVDKIIGDWVTIPVMSICNKNIVEAMVSSIENEFIQHRIIYSLFK